MKTFLHFIVFMLAGMSLNAQIVLFSETFTDSIPFPPANWTSIDADGDGHNWNWDSYHVIQRYASSQSYINGIGALTPDNYLITPQINLHGMSGKLTVAYQIGAASATYFAEHYQIAISTTDNQASSFTNIIKEETLPDTLGNAWGTRLYDISQFFGQNIYIAWRHFNCTDMYKLMLDSIFVEYKSNVGINDKTASAMHLYPNPASDFIDVTGNMDHSIVRIFDMTGKNVAEAVLTDNKAHFDLSTLPEGIYFVSLLQNGNNTTRKFAIQR